MLKWRISSLIWDQTSAHVRVTLEKAQSDSLSVLMSPPALSWWQLLDSPLVFRTGMLCLAGAGVCTEVRSSSESLLLELSPLLEDEELLESEELLPLLSWSMTRASAINSARATTRKAQGSRERLKRQSQTYAEEEKSAPNPNKVTDSA